MKYFILLVCILLTFCGQTEKKIVLFEEFVENDSIPVLDFSDLDLNQTHEFSDVFDSISFVKLETRDDALIGSIDKVIAVDDKFVILDASMAKAIFVFDGNGRFLNRIGNNGRGPKEYDSPDDIAYDQYRQEIVIRNNNRKVLMSFKLDGTFVKEVPVDFYFGTLGVVDDKTIAIYRNNKGRGERDYNLVMIDREGNVKNQFFPINRSTDLLSPPCKMAFFSYGDTLQFSPMYSRTVYSLNESGLSPKYRLDFGKRNIPYALLKNITNRDLDNNIRESRNYMYCSTFAETADHLIFRFVYYNGLVYNCYYSKVTGKYFAGSVFINDIYGLVTSGRFCCTNGDSIVSVIEPGSFVGIRDLANELAQGKANKHNENHGGRDSVQVISTLSNEIKQNIKKEWESTDFNLSREEISFINSVKEGDNPVLRIARLKKF